MPDECSRSERQFPSLIEETPAEVDIVSGCDELGLKPSNRVQGFPAYYEITAGKVLRAEVLGKDVRRGSGSRGYDGFL